MNCMTAKRSHVLRMFTTIITLSVASLVGCNSNNITDYNAPGACTPPAGVDVSLIYPEPGSTGVPNNFSEIIVASSVVGGLSSGYRTYVTNANNTTSNLYGYLQPYPNPLPTPNAAPPFSGQVTYQLSESPGITWPASSSLQVYLAGSPNCRPVDLLGSFTVSATLATGPLGPLEYTPINGASPAPTAAPISSTSVNAAYTPGQVAFVTAISEANYTGKFTASIVYFALPLTAACYSVTMDATGTLATFAPSSTATTQAMCNTSGGTSIEGALFEDQLGNNATLYFLP